MVRESIAGLLEEMLEKKVIAKQKEIDTLLEKGVSESNPKLQRAIQALDETQDYYQYDKWLKHAAYNMTKSATLATHISKGVHSMSKGDSVLFKDMADRPNYVAGSHNIDTDVLDISGSAASLPIYNFINLKVGDTTIKQLIEAADPAIVLALSDDTEVALGLLQQFQDFLVKQVERPETSDLNKQLLFPVNGDSFEINSIEDLEYETVVPLYASVFCHEVRNQLQGIIFSEEYREAVKNRFSKDADELDHQEYKTVRDLATIKLGGSKPANISKVVVMSGGEIFLLPNLPPKGKGARGIRLSKSIESVFQSKKINSMLKADILKLARASIKYDRMAIFKTKNNKRAALEGVIAHIFEIALVLQKNQAGWLLDHSLHPYEKYWLDPKCGTLAGMEAYEEKRKSTQWQSLCIAMMSLYINNALIAVAGEKADIFDVDYFNDIRIEVEAMAKKFQRNNKEVFNEQ